KTEVSPNNRAGCTDGVCKKAASKCVKGSLRFGTWTTIMEHESWKWKHWGCVSGEQMAHVRDICQKADGTFDFDAFDGYDELGDHPDLQEKIRKAVEQGHVDPADFNGDPWMNKPGQRGIRGKKPKDWDDGDGAEVSSLPAGSDPHERLTPARRKRRLPPRARSAAASPPPPPMRRRRRSPRRSVPRRRPSRPSRRTTRRSPNPRPSVARLPPLL
ncbi:zf-PARP-domain-containing protein, partial [Colletotrichum falcatum]